MNYSFELLLLLNQPGGHTETVRMGFTSPFGAVPRVGENLRVVDVPGFYDSRMWTGRVMSVSHAFHRGAPFTTADHIVHQVTVHADHEEPLAGIV
jgi:hypothetical protein